MTLPNRRRNIRVIFIICIVAFVAWLSVRIVEGIKMTSKAFEEDLPPIYTISKQDSDLISPRYRKQLKVVEVRRSKVRDNIAVLSIAEKYTIILQRLKLIPGSPLTQSVNTTEASTDRSTMVVYAVVNLGDFSYQWKAGGVEVASRLFLTLSGRSIETLRKSDSVLSYSLQAKDVSLRYGQDSRVDTYLTTGDGFLTKAVPMNIMLLKKNNAVYFIVLSAKGGGELPKPDFIEETVNVAS